MNKRSIAYDVSATHILSVVLPHQPRVFDPTARVQVQVWMSTQGGSILIPNVSKSCDHIHVEAVTTDVDERLNAKWTRPFSPEIFSYLFPALMRLITRRVDKRAGYYLSSPITIWWTRRVYAELGLLISLAYLTVSPPKVIGFTGRPY